MVPENVMYQNPLFEADIVEGGAEQDVFGPSKVLQPNHQWLYYKHYCLVQSSHPQYVIQELYS